MEHPCLTGVVMGWLRLPHQPHSNPRAGLHSHRSLFAPHLHGLYNGLLRRHHPVHADIVRRFPGRLVVDICLSVKTLLMYFLIYCFLTKWRAHADFVSLSTTFKWILTYALCVV